MFYCMGDEAVTATSYCSGRPLNIMCQMAHAQPHNASCTLVKCDLWTYLHHFWVPRTSMVHRSVTVKVPQGTAHRWLLLHAATSVPSPPPPARHYTVTTLSLQACDAVSTLSIQACYTVTTLSLQACYTVTTLSLQACYRIQLRCPYKLVTQSLTVLTTLLQTHYAVLTRLLHSKYTVLARLLHSHYTVHTSLLHISGRLVSCILPC